MVRNQSLTVHDEAFETGVLEKRTPGLSVGVVVDLELSPTAGGHVKCWQRFAEAAATMPDVLDLTVYFLGDSDSSMALSDTVRYVMVPPALGTKRFPFLRNEAGDTDLAPYHFKLAKQLRSHALLHATDTFTFAQTARSVARRTGKPLVSSLHTDLPKFTKVYSREIIGRMTGNGALTRLLLDGARLDERFESSARRRIERFLRASDRVLVSREEDKRLLADIVPANRISRLRRGVDKALFSPAHRDPDRLRSTFSLPPNRPVVLFVGRIDDSKQIMTLANAARILLEKKRKLHVLAIGQGSSMEAVRRMLGPNVTLPGVLPQETLSWVYPSCDLFVFPSDTEVSPNVVQEARASGLPTVLSASDRGAQFVRKDGEDGLLVMGQNPTVWANALQPLVTDAVRRAELSYNTRKTVEQTAASWLDVLRQDLMPVWTEAAATGRRA